MSSQALPLCDAKMLLLHDATIGVSMETAHTHTHAHMMLGF